MPLYSSSPPLSAAIELTAAIQSNDTTRETMRQAILGWRSGGDEDCSLIMAVVYLFVRAVEDKDAAWLWWHGIIAPLQGLDGSIGSDPQGVAPGQLIAPFQGLVQKKTGAPAGPAKLTPAGLTLSALHCFLI